MSLPERAKRLLLNPASEWQEIASESHTVQTLFTNYAMVLAAIPAAASFIGLSIMGVPIGASVASTILGYVLSLGSVYALALVIDALAPHFHAHRDFTQSLKVATFSMTPAWATGVFNILPALAILAMIGSLYSLYLLYLGLTVIKAPPQEQAMAYTIVVMIVMIVLMVIAGAIPALAIPTAVRGF